MASTTRSSSSVKPRVLPVADVLGVAIPCLVVVGSVRKDVVLAVRAWEAVSVRVPPGIRETGLLLHIRSVPLGAVGRSLHERLKPFVTGRETPHVQVARVDGGRQRLDLDFCGFHLS